MFPGGYKRMFREAEACCDEVTDSRVATARHRAGFIAAAIVTAPRRLVVVTCMARAFDVA